MMSFIYHYKTNRRNLRKFVFMEIQVFWSGKYDIEFTIRKIGHYLSTLWKRSCTRQYANRYPKRTQGTFKMKRLISNERAERIYKQACRLPTQR